mgnify:CR=1 FL=1
MKPLRVVAAVLSSEGRILLTQRPPGKHLAGLWEFPGGKVEPDESDEAALRRELREELGVQSRVKGLVAEIVHDYPEKRVHLLLYDAEITAGRPEPKDASDLAWFMLEELRTLPMPDADAPLIEALAQRGTKQAK